MTRRDFVMLLGGTAAAWPLAARAQQPAMPMVGYLDFYAAEPTGIFLTAFRNGLSEAGYTEGHNVAIEYRYANTDKDRLPELAADLIQHRVAVIVTPFGTAAALAVKAATTIPIVFMTSADPVQVGLVASFNRPGGNVTGLSIMNVELGAKRLGFLHELIPGALRIAALINPNSAIAESLIREAQTGASTIGWRVEVVYASTKDEIDAAFGRFGQQRLDAVFISADQFFTSRRVQFATLAAHYRVPAIYSYRAFAEVGGLMSYGRAVAALARFPNGGLIVTRTTEVMAHGDLIVALAARHRLPTVYPLRSFVTRGGLISYGNDVTTDYRMAAGYIDRIFKGEKPADLPVQYPTKYDLVINLKTAKALGLTVPPSLLARADEVIE